MHRHGNSTEGDRIDSHDELTAGLRIPISSLETRPEAVVLYPTKNDLPEATGHEAVALLNQRLADCIDLQTQCKQAHWRHAPINPMPSRIRQAPRARSALAEAVTSLTVPARPAVAPLPCGHV
jgi:hypothetical protein